jgi:ABC-type uncharacterized transport system ATPase subunit
MDFNISIPKVDDSGAFQLSIKGGNAAVLLGANGAGKPVLRLMSRGKSRIVTEFRPRDRFRWLIA